MRIGVARHRLLAVPRAKPQSAVQFGMPWGRTVPSQPSHRFQASCQPPTRAPNPGSASPCRDAASWPSGLQVPDFGPPSPPTKEACLFGVFMRRGGFGRIGGHCPWIMRTPPDASVPSPGNTATSFLGSGGSALRRLESF